MSLIGLKYGVLACKILTWSHFTSLYVEVSLVPLMKTYDVYYLILLHQYLEYSSNLEENSCENAKKDSRN